VFLATSQLAHLSRCSTGESANCSTHQFAAVHQGHDTLTAAMQQVERTERVLKLLWRDQNQQRSDWAQRFEELEGASERIRRAAVVVLRNLLR
jgi:hypothetical protein